MSLNPLNELKRRLDEDATPLPKRLCLAKNIIHSHHFPTAPKERIVGLWLQGLTQNNLLSSVELKNVLQWLNDGDELTSELKIHLITIVSHYVQNNLLQNHDIQNIVMFLENTKITTQLSQQIDSYLTITITLLQCLRGEYVTDKTLCQKIFENMTKYYKECKKKFEFITKLLNEGNIQTLFSFLDTECRKSVIDVCKNILFPINKKSFYISYLQTLIRKNNIDELIAEKGDNIQSVIKIMNALFEYPKNQTEKNPQFIRDFVDVFVCSFHSENQIIFAFYIMVANFLNMPQNYIIPAMDVPSLIFEENEEKTKRNLFLNMLEILLENEADVNVRLTDTFGEKIPKVEIKKNFMTFLQVVMMGQLKLQGKLDKTSLQIIKTAIKLDPTLIEQKINEILPPLMAAKKTSKVITSYTDMMNCLLEMLFKLSRGTLFLNQILPFIKNILEASNTEQFQFKQALQQSIESGTDDEKLRNKIITGKDILPDECVDFYGKLTSELMFRQNKEHLESLQKNFEEHCLLMLEEGFVSPSIISLIEVLAAILSSFFRHNKMADHTVPLPIAQDFWQTYQKFEEECIKKFGECILKLSYNPPLIKSFLQLCLGFSQLKLLNLKYSNVKIDITHTIDTDVFDVTLLLPCFTKEQWIQLTSTVKDYEIEQILNNLLIVKAMAVELISIQSNEDYNEVIVSIKTHLIRQLSSNADILSTNYYVRTLFDNLDSSQSRQVAKNLFKMYMENTETEIYKSYAIINNKMLLNSLVLETAKNITKSFNNCESLTKGLSKQEFDIASFAKENNIKEYFENITMTEDQETIKHCLDLIQQLQVPFLEENYQLVVIFVLLATKKCGQTKKISRHVDNILQSIYELSLQPPDLYKLFPVQLIFSFEDDTILRLLTLTIKTSNNMLVVRNMLESAVKRVRVDSDLVRSIVNIILSNKITDSVGIDVFNNSVFQITCMILPLIAKQRKAITASIHRSILAELQDKLQKKLVDSFKNIDFSQHTVDKSGNTEEHIEHESNVATLNAMAAYSLTLSKFFETNDNDEIKNLAFVWDSMDFFIQNAIQCIQSALSKPQHIETSLQLINIPLRHIKKLEMHDSFKNKDKMLKNIWLSVKARLVLMHEKCVCMEEMAVVIKYLCELSSVECFGSTVVADLTSLVVLEKPGDIIKDGDANKINLHVSKYVWTQCLKANIVGPKCVALSKLMHRTCMNLRFWIRQHYEINTIPAKKRKKVNLYIEESSGRIFKVDDKICEFLKIYLETLTEVIFAAKKITIDHKFIDSIFCLQHMYYYIMDVVGDSVMCEISWTAFFELFNGCISVLNSLLAARKEMLEDRWPCFMACYRVLVTHLCKRSTSVIKLEKSIEDKLAEAAHNVEKLTQSISKQKKQVSRIAAYTVGDMCSLLERLTPSRMVRQHVENSIVMLLQASDTYAMAFLKRSLANSAGHMTISNMYNVYKKYHKYVGNA